MRHPCPVSAESERPRRSIAIRTPTTQAWRSLGAFRAAYGWLLRDLIGFSRRRVIAVLVLNLLGVALQWGVVGGVLLFVGELTGEGGAFQVPLLGGLELPVDASLGIVTLWGVIVLSLVAAASLSTYRAETMGFETAQRYVERNGKKLLGAMLASRSRTEDDEQSPARQLQLVLARDQTMILRALLVLQRSLRAVLMVLVAGAVLALINPVLSGIVALVATLFVVPYYLVNRQVVTAAGLLEQRNASARASILRFVEHATSREPNPAVMRVVPDLYPRDAAIGERWAALRDIILGAQRTTALMSGLVGTCLVAVVVAFGLIIARDEASWVAALTFIIGLNLASGAFVQLAALVTAANRFLPHVQEYIAFASSYSKRPELTRMAAGGDFDLALPTVRASAPVLPASDRELPLSGGVRALCVCPEGIDRLNVHTVLQKLVSGREIEARRLRSRTFFYGDSTSLPPVAVQMLLGPQGVRALEELGLAEEVDRLPDGKATVLNSEIQERMSAFLRYALGVLEGLESDLLVLGWSSFARLSAKERARLLDRIGTRPLLFVITRAPRRQPAEITHTILLSERGIAGMGGSKWYASVVDGLSTARAGTPEPVGVAAGTGLDEDLGADA